MATYKLTLGSEEHELEVEEQDVGYRVKLDDTWYQLELDRMGEVTDRALAQVAWVRTIPPVAEITSQSYCKGAEERENFAHWLKIVALNEALYDDLGAASAAQVRITNSYRLMFGHRPLAVSLNQLESR